MAIKKRSQRDLNLFHLLLFLLLPTPISSQNSSSCPLDFSVLQKFVSAATSSPPSDNSTVCQFAAQSLRLVLAEYLLASSRFIPPQAAATSCWSSLQSALSPILPSSFSLPSSCGYQAKWIADPCMNITTLAEFYAVVPISARDDMARSCNASSLIDVPVCTACSTSLNRVKASYLPGDDGNDVIGCTAYPFIYAAAKNRFGPADNGTAYCLFLLNSNSTSRSGGGGVGHWVYGLVAGLVVVAILAGLAVWFLIRRQRRQRRRRKRSARKPSHSQALESIKASTTLMKFTFEEIKAATASFSIGNIVGRGGYGNVYRGTLSDGSEIAVKRFKNCSAAGDDSFAHEVEVIASVRHINLVALRGYCIATTPMEGHQRIIVCDLMQNGSLHDHLFVFGESQLSWPLRQKIAVGMARGLAYLHHGAQPAIIHRDIKASNVLLDEDFEAKVADFGLAKFAPEGMTHVSTRVAGTLGYVAPEYALYGQLTEKSDVYSFGVVLLELLSGKKAFISLGEGQSFVITDWAWSRVRQGRTLDVIQEGMEELGPRELLEKYVHVAVICTHPQLHARPTMDQIVKILETDLAVPSIPDRPIPITANMDDIERSVSSSGSGQLFSLTGFQAYSYGNDNVSSDSSEKV